MRVLSVGNAYPPHHLGGYEVICQGVVERLRADGHLARVLTTDYRRPATSDGPTEQPPELDVHRELRWYWRDHEWPSMGFRQRLALERHNALVLDRHLEEFAPDVVAWWAVGGMSLGLLERVRRRGLPACLFVLDPWPIYGPMHDLWLRTWRLPGTAALAERATGLPARVEMARAGRWLFCSEAMRQLTLEAGIEVPDWEIVRPGVEEAYLELPREPAPSPWRWRLLYAGRVVRQKGVHTAITALARLPGETVLRIVGPGDEPYRRELVQLADRLGVSGRVRWEPARGREEMFEVYRWADAVLFPVEWAEPWGLVPLEAMASGRPVVATGRGGSGEYPVDGHNSLIFDAGNADGLAGALRSLAEGPELRGRLRQGGWETAREHRAETFERLSVGELARAAAAANV